MDYDFFADTTEDDPETDMKFERSKANVEILMRQQELYHQYMGRGSKQVRKPSKHHAVAEWSACGAHSTEHRKTGYYTDSQDSARGDMLWDGGT